MLINYTVQTSGLQWVAQANGACFDDSNTALSPLISSWVSYMCVQQLGKDYNLPLYLPYEKHYTVKFHFKALDLYNFIRGFGLAYKRGGGGSYKRNKKKFGPTRQNVSELYELKLTYNYILSYIYNTFIVCHSKRRIHFKNIYKTDLCDRNNWNGTEWKSKN